MELTIDQILIPTAIKIQDRHLRCKTLSKCLNVSDQVEVVSKNGNGSLLFPAINGLCLEIIENR